MAQVPLAPPPQTGQPIDGWLFLLWKRLTATGQLLWSGLSFTGSNLTDIETRNHADLQNINTASYTHLTATNHTDLTDAGDSTLHYHASDRDSANFTGANWTDLTDAGDSTLHYHAADRLDANQTFTDVTTNNASTTAHGFLLKATAPASGLYNYVGIGNGETDYTNKALFDATVPSTQAFGDAASAGTAAVAARRDHKHEMMAAPTTISGNAGSATYASAITVALDATAASFYPVFVSATTGNLAAKVDGDLTYNPSTNTLTSTTFAGALTGTASGNLTSADIGSTVQAYDAQLTSVAALAYAGNALKVVRVNATETDFELAAAVTGTVTSVAQTFTGGLISVAGSPVTTSGTLALTVAGTSGGIPYFSGATTWATSAALAANAIVVGGGAGVAPSTVTTGTGVVTALGVAVGSSGAFVTNGGGLGTPSSGTLTNCTFPTLNQNTTGYAEALKSATTTVSVSAAAAPTSGQVLTATSSTAATWQTPSASASGYSSVIMLG